MISHIDKDTRYSVILLMQTNNTIYCVRCEVFGENLTYSVRTFADGKFIDRMMFNVEEDG